MSEIILVVDDNPELVEGVKLTLEMEGYQVLTAYSGQEALEVLEQATPDLILADIMMPNLDGYELYVRVHGDPRWVHIPFVFLTAKTSKEDIRRGKEMGVDDYITKPFDPQDVVAAVRGKLRRMAELTGRPLSSDVMGNLRSLWRGRVGPVPFPIVALIGLVLVIALPLVIVLNQRPQPGVSPLPTLHPTASEMVIVPAGPFIAGADVPGVPAAHEVTLPAFQIDKYEVTFAQYRRFVEEAGHYAPWGTYPDALADHPVTNVSWEDARAYCLWAGKRLPTEMEWEKAARGVDGRIYPWGDVWQTGRANTLEADVGGTKPVGSYPDGASPYGAMDMAGNVYEWVEDWAGASQVVKVIRGGAWNARHDWAQTFRRNTARPTDRRNNLGFRCARDVEGQP